MHCNVIQCNYSFQLLRYRGWITHFSPTPWDHTFASDAFHVKPFSPAFAEDTLDSNWRFALIQVARKISQQTAGRLSFAHCRLSAGLLKAAEAAKKAAVCACVQRTHRSSCAAALQQHQVVVARVEKLGSAAVSPLVLAAGRPLGWAESQAMAPPPPATSTTPAQLSR